LVEFESQIAALLMEATMRITLQTGETALEITTAVTLFMVEAETLAVVTIYEYKLKLGEVLIFQLQQAVTYQQ
jgi:hypothetical protein